MACCGGAAGTLKYRVTDPEGNVYVYLTEPEARIALATYGGGSYEIIREPAQ